MYTNNYQNQPQMMGQTYGNQMPQSIPFTQPLKEEDIRELQKSDAFFSLKVPKQELDRAICTHKYPNTNQYSTDILPNGDIVCRICGAKMNPDSFTPEKVEKIVADVVNLLQCCKLMYVNIPENVARQFFSMIPFINRIPQLYKIAVDSHQRFSPSGSVNQEVYQNNGLLNSFRQVIGGGINPNGYYGAPMYNQQPGYNNGAPMYNNAPYANPGYQQPSTNPFYTAPNTQTANTMGQPVTPPIAQPAPKPQPVPKVPTVPQGNPAVERVNATATLDA